MPADRATEVYINGERYYKKLVKGYTIQPSFPGLALIDDMDFEILFDITHYKEKNKIGGRGEMVKFLLPVENFEISTVECRE